MAQDSLTRTREAMLTVVCSCGKTTTIIFKPALGHFVALDSSWEYRTSAELQTGERMGWYCGAPGHNEDDEFESEAR